MTLAETDGESTYRVSINDKQIAEVKNPPTDKDYRPIKHRFESIALKTGDVMRVEFNTASNGKIPEGEGFAFARGRWRSLDVMEPGATKPTSGLMRATFPAATPIMRQSVTKSAEVISVRSEPASDQLADVYDPSNASIIHRQKTDGTVVVEAEDYDAVNKQLYRTWYRTTAELTPDVKPDPDPNHVEGASGGAYLELLPDTRVTHDDPLVNGVSFTNQPGERSVLYYPIEFSRAGRFYVWVRMCCTGSEDNGIHVGLNDTWPASGARMQFTGKHGQWQWDSRQRTEKVHTGVLGQIWLDIEEPGLHTVTFSMREDGFEFDKFYLTPEKEALENKSTDLGPMP
ncbi:MAG: hypothetical protein AAF802_31730 [Planctomycetota bacterium]